jgi:hypothetical protein
MTVSEYNKSRDIKDVAAKTWIDGTRFNILKKFLYIENI